MIAAIDGDLSKGAQEPHDRRPSDLIVITGRQIREARMMLRWTGETFCTRAGVTGDMLTRAEAVDDYPAITLMQNGRIQQALERAGISFGQNGAVLMALKNHP